ncbi:MAG: hypothetical protein WGN25_17195 [Candidatus Electrothrix sp. GW3-4]|uniref:hypothetical protein n=1 Tax=Candidatus Electrothrix sp. GW3-4 TaxID=3126740 RepID=UPI0030D38F63
MYRKILRLVWSVALASGLAAGLGAGIAGCDDGSGNTSVEPLLDNCAQLSGTYNGTYSETACDGAQNSGTIDNFVIDDACALGLEWSGIALASGAKIYNVTATSFDIVIPTDYTGCGTITGTCQYTEATAYCTYTYEKGGNGVLDLKKS